MVIRENEILVAGKRGLEDSDFPPAFRGSNVPNACRSKEIRRNAASMEFAQRVGSDVPDLKFRADPHVYLRIIDRHLRNELGEQSRWEM